MKLSHLTAAIALIALSLAVAQPATAYKVTSKGAPGTTSTPFTFGNYDPWGSTITVPWRTVFESRAYSRYDQQVCVTPRLWTIKLGRAPSWVHSAGTTNCAWISSASTSVRVNGTDFTGVVPYQGYGVDVVVKWRLSNGRVIGSRTYDYNSTGDYRCSNGHAKCIIGTTNWGGGAYMMFDW